MSAEPTLASETTLLGLLQRGRGGGLQTALSGSAADTRAALAECLLHDPRWDAQQETRELYYADVAAACGMPVAEIHAVLSKLADGGDETRFYGQYQVAGVLGVLARRGDEDALHVLTQEVLVGSAWHVAAEELADRLPREHWLPLGATLFGRLSDAEVTKLAEDRYGLDPWAAWSESERGFQKFVAAAEAARPTSANSAAPYAKPDTRMSTPELLAIVEKRNWIKAGRLLENRQRREDAPVLAHAVRTGTEFQKAVALRGLRALGDTSVLDEAVAIVQNGSLGMCQRAALNYVASLPPEVTLESARQWVRQPWPLALAGREVLEHHATRADLDLLRDTLATASEQQDLYAACFAVDALGCFDSPEAHPELRHFYESTPYAYGRWRAARALARVEANFAEHTAIECLFDCEPQGRTLGIKFADRRKADVGERIQQIGSDPPRIPRSPLWLARARRSPRREVPHAQLRDALQH